MKKIYLLAFTLGAFAFSANAQIIQDDMESYSTGGVHEDHWSSWSGVSGAEDMIITTDQAQSGSQSGLIDAGAAAGGPQDAILLLGNQTSGEYDLSFFMYIPSDKTAYFNFQGETVAGGAGPVSAPGTGVFNSGNVTFNLDGLSPGVVEDIDADGTVNNTFAYPQNFWFEVKFHFDVDATMYTLSIDGVDGAPVLFGADAVVGGIDFFAIDPNNQFYVDDVTFTAGTAGVNDFAADSFKIYPNPVKDILNISTKTVVDNVTVYDVLGKTVLTAQPDVISPKIDMSGLASGAYLVQVTIGNTSKTVKVLK